MCIPAFPILLLSLTGACAATSGGDEAASAALPVVRTYDCDVCVVGGGPAGTAAAIAAARGGASTIVIEQYGCLGGMGTVGLVSVFMNFRHAGGVFREVLGALDELGARRGSVFDAARMQVALDRLVTGAGARPLFYTRAIGVQTAPGRDWQGKPRQTISALYIHNKTGVQAVRAKIYIDCTGDGDLAAWAGAPFTFGREADSVPQPMTMVFRMGGCTWGGGWLNDHPALKDYWTSFAMGPNPGEITLNMTRIHNRSGISGEDLSAATVEGREAVLQAVEILRAKVEGFENAYLVELPTQIGVRETRHILGAAVLTGEQCIKGMKRADVIARCQYDIDIHDPEGTGATVVKLEKPYDIPYRCLIPKGVDNLLVAGRAISADHTAHSSLRIQPTCYDLGEAAGTAAAICVREGIGPWEMAPFLSELQETLTARGADLGRTRR